jgi:hypothetical protein
VKVRYGWNKVVLNKAVLVLAVQNCQGVLLPRHLKGKGKVFTVL